MFYEFEITYKEKKAEMRKTLKETREFFRHIQKDYGKKLELGYLSQFNQYQD